MHKIIIAYETDDMFVPELPKESVVTATDSQASLQTVSETKALPQTANPSQNNINNSLTSFVIIIFAVIIIAVIVLLYKKFFTVQRYKEEYTVPDYAASAAKKKTKQKKDNTNSDFLTQEEIINQKLETPSSLADCIMNFLERTK